MTRRERIEQWIADGDSGARPDVVRAELRALWTILDAVNAYDRDGTLGWYDAIWAAISEYNNELGGGE